MQHKQQKQIQQTSSAKFIIDTDTCGTDNESIEQFHHCVIKRKK